jgi:hypothetical protein
MKGNLFPSPSEVISSQHKKLLSPSTKKEEDSFSHHRKIKRLFKFLSQEKSPLVPSKRRKAHFLTVEK